ncbi:MAG: YkgJ family cysteine cluster protein [Phycisphaerae bacterium]|nr:YkgJ family cysteine cluster protein [Phycisphaerae bacterium]NUQ45531.1 YkgJ family cysteine cluster protein [Phycisphaerae bacterium]
MELNVIPPAKKKLDPFDPEPCADCGHCCRYVTIAIKAPRNRNDYDEIRWYLLHENMRVFIDSDGWYVEVLTRCRHLDGHRCGIYESRPIVCEEYEIDNCERYGEGDPYIELFTNEQEYLEYLRKNRPRAYQWLVNPRQAEREAINMPPIARGGGNGIHAPVRGGGRNGRVGHARRPSRFRGNGRHGSNGVPRRRARAGAAAESTPAM